VRFGLNHWPFLIMGLALLALAFVEGGDKSGYTLGVVFTLLGFIPSFDPPRVRNRR
jgi:hypothetical protein